MGDNKICGKCKYNRFEKYMKFGGELSRFYCNNKESHAYLCDTRYDDFCADFEAKEAK